MSKSSDFNIKINENDNGVFLTFDICLVGEQNQNETVYSGTYDDVFDYVWTEFENRMNRYMRVISMDRFLRLFKTDLIVKFHDISDPEKQKIRIAYDKSFENRGDKSNTLDKVVEAFTGHPYKLKFVSGSCET